MHSCWFTPFYFTDRPPTPDFMIGIEKCNPKNITLLVWGNEIYIAWDIANYTSGCSFLVTVWNCSQPDTRLSCTVPDPNQSYVSRLSLNKCLQTNHLYYNDTIVDIKWDHSNCTEEDNGCSTPIYILSDTG